jgi:Uma2 family endonuclease
MKLNYNMRGRCQPAARPARIKGNMDAQSIPAPITVEQYERIPDPPGGRYELHHGELVFVKYPVRQHRALQRALRKFLEPMAEPRGFLVDTEYPYRPIPEHEVWGADVACVREERDRADAKWLNGPPEIVIEVKSPSNTKAELSDKAMTTLTGQGAVEFWIVDPNTRTITVHTRQGMSVYLAGQTVPVSIFAGQISVDEVFIGCE